MSVMVLAATMTSVSESSAKHRRARMAGVENYEYDLSSPSTCASACQAYPVYRPGLHLWCAGGRLYSPTRIRRRLAVYQSACSTCLTPVAADPGNPTATATDPNEPCWDPCPRCMCLRHPSGSIGAAHRARAGRWATLHVRFRVAVPANKGQSRQGAAAATLTAGARGR